MKYAAGYNIFVMTLLGVRSYSGHPSAEVHQGTGVAAYIL